MHDEVGEDRLDLVTEQCREDAADGGLSGLFVPEQRDVARQIDELRLSERRLARIEEAAVLPDDVARRHLQVALASNREGGRQIREPDGQGGQLLLRRPGGWGCDRDDSGERWRGCFLARPASGQEHDGDERGNGRSQHAPGMVRLRGPARETSTIARPWPPSPSPGLPVEAVRDAPCRVRDGTTVYADVYRPVDGGPHPALLMREPYDKTTAQTGSGYNHPAWWAAQGWVTVVQDVRGRFRSEGEFYPFVDEAKDGYDAVEWAARLDGVDGRVATYGFSYPGATQLLAATERPPSLVAICPGMTASQYWEGWTYQGGALHLAFAANWAAGLAAYTAIGRRDEREITRLEGVLGSADWFSHLPLLEPPGLRREDAPYYFDWIEHAAYDDYWRATAIDEDYARIQGPGLHVGGWYDVFLSGTVANFGGLAGRQKLLVGPWQHKGPGSRCSAAETTLPPSRSTTGSCASSTRWSRGAPPASSTPPSPRT